MRTNCFLNNFWIFLINWYEKKYNDSSVYIILYVIRIQYADCLCFQPFTKLLKISTIYFNPTIPFKKNSLPFAVNQIPGDCDKSKLSKNSWSEATDCVSFYQPVESESQSWFYGQTGGAKSRPGTVLTINIHIIWPAQNGYQKTMHWVPGLVISV